MPAPHSNTGDDLVELHCHGGQAAADQALHLLFNAGCRLAEPGEFTFRAFVNGKLDLAQAEAVNDVITSGSDLALKVAENQLNGVLSRQLDAIYSELNNLRAECESRLDFPDEELAYDPDVPGKIDAIIRQISKLYDTRNIGGALRDGISVVLAGRPNAGKSSLMNLLLGFDRAIVTPIPGTTRDTIEAHSVIRNLPVRLTDTAGLRESSDVIEQIGVERSRKSLDTAHVTLYLLDSSAPDLAVEIAEMERTKLINPVAVWNKSDLAPGKELPKLTAPTVKISVLTGDGIDSLLDTFARIVADSPRPTVPEVAINARAAQLLKTAMDSLTKALNAFRLEEFELAAADIKIAIDHIGEITGKTVTPDVLDNIFSRFCIGK
ncbi:MAG: tRNA uridine-5-carboxymethylaminomethyl(34) synthesis GTPase MnmE [Victivallales bacterium]|jgi:tRNA modification GTPase|nr:tRNA uridine-5-carboxymethylaminomethyl(34) synthesis GTPase MnmE [Victivallales bacterium]